MHCFLSRSTVLFSIYWATGSAWLNYFIHGTNVQPNLPVWYFPLQMSPVIIEETLIEGLKRCWKWQQVIKLAAVLSSWPRPHPSASNWPRPRVYWPRPHFGNCFALLFFLEKFLVLFRGFGVKNSNAQTTFVKYSETNVTFWVFMHQFVFGC